MNTVSAPITAIQVGDIVVTGHGTQTMTVTAERTTDMKRYTTNGVDYTVTDGGDFAHLTCSICQFWVQSPYSWAWADTHARHHTETVNVL